MEEGSPEKLPSQPMSPVKTTPIRSRFMIETSCCRATEVQVRPVERRDPLDGAKLLCDNTANRRRGSPQLAFSDGSALLSNKLSPQSHVRHNEQVGPNGTGRPSRRIYPTAGRVAQAARRRRGADRGYGATDFDSLFAPWWSGDSPPTSIVEAAPLRTSLPDTASGPDGR